MNDRFDLRIITQPHSQVSWGYFRRLVFGNSSTKHNKLTYFSNSMLFCSDVLLPFSHIPRCIHAKTPDFPRLFEPRDYVMSKFGCSSDVRNFLLRTYCTSYYGSALWNLSAAYIERFYVAWRKCVRRVCGVPSQTHCVLLPCLYGDSGINIQLLRRFASLYYGLKNSDNKLVHLCANCQVLRSFTIHGRAKQEGTPV